MEVAGVERGLAQTHEAIMLCGALKTHQDRKSIVP